MPTSSSMMVLRAVAAVAAAALLGSAATARANCNLIPQLVTAYPSTTGEVDRALALPGDVVTVRLDLACQATLTGFARDAAQNRVELRFDPPGAGAGTAVEVTGARVANCGTEPDARCDTLVFGVPDTDGFLAPAGDGRGLAGPAEIVVTDVDTGEVLARIGPLFEPTTSCRDRVPEATFQHFVVLPPATPFAVLEAGSAAVLATLDGGGNALVPIDFRDVLVSDPAAPLFRLLSGSALVPAFPPSPTPIQIPDARYLRSFATNGRPIPPILGALAGGTGVFGSVDAPVSVLRIARVDPDDASAPPLYDLSDRLLDGRGPIVIAGASAERRPPAFLGDVEESPAGMVFAVDETITGTGLNDDSDALDRVAHTTDFETGATTNLQLALTEGSPGARTTLPLASDGAGAAFLVSEYRQSNRDQVPPSRNGDADWEDDTLALATVAGSVAALPLAVDPGAAVNGRPLVLSEAATFFRVREADVAPRTIERVSEAAGGASANAPSEMSPVGSVFRSVSADGRFVAFTSTASNLVPGDANGLRDVFVADRVLGDVVFRVPQVLSGVAPNGESREPSLSANGQWVAYVSEATNLDPGPADAAGSVFVTRLDFEFPEIARIVVAGGAAAREPDISADGRYVAFTSPDPSVGSGDDANGADDVFVLDRDADGDFAFDEPGDLVITRISDVFGAAAAGASDQPSISADGRFVAFRTEAPEFGAGPSNPQVVVADRDPDGDGVFDPFDTVIEGVSVTPSGDPAGFASREPSVSADGRFVAFGSSAPDLLETPDGDDLFDVYVRDRVAARTERVSDDPDGLPAGAESRTPSISADGRFVAFQTDAANLVFPIATGPVIVTHDRLTNTNEYASANAAGVPTPGAAANPSISADGRFVAFETTQEGLVPTDANGLRDVFARGIFDDFDTDLNGDLDRADTVAAVLQEGNTLYGPAASALSVSGGRALALVPERDEGFDDLNGDSDREDRVVQLLEPLGFLNEVNSFLAGNRISLGEQIGCASTPEAAQGPAGGSDRNGDGDREDDVLAVGSLDDWRNGLPRSAQVAVDALAALGPWCVVSVPELAQSGAPPGDVPFFGNDDEDFGDRLLGLVAADGTVLATDAVVADFAVEPEGTLVAFRTCESEDGNDGTVYNGDGDVDECAMRVLDLSGGAPGEVVDTGFAAIPCDFPACATFFEPYRVRGDVVAFAAREAEQSGPQTGRRPDGSLGGVGCLPSSAENECDFTGDGDALDTVIVTWSRRSRSAQVFEIFEDAPPGSVVPFPTATGGFREVLRLESDEARLQQDCNGDGDLEDPCVVLVADSDGDGVYDESLAGGDNAPGVPNPDQADADGDGLGDVIDPDPGTPDLLVCDVDRDRDVDRTDVEVIFGDRGMTARPGDPRDPDRDGRITVADSAFCTDSCTRPDCSPPPGCGLGAEVVVALAGWALGRRRRARR